MRMKIATLAMASALVAGTASAAPADVEAQIQLPGWSLTSNQGKAKGIEKRGTGSQGKGLGILRGVGIGHGKGPASPH